MPEIPVFRGLDRPIVRSQVERGMAAADPRRPARPSAGLARCHAPAGACRRLADRDVPRVGRRHRAVPGRALDQHRHGDPEGAAHPRRDPGDRDHGRRARPREPDALGRVQHLARPRGGPDRRQLRPADPDGPARRHPSGARVDRGCPATPRPRHAGGRGGGAVRPAADRRLRRHAADAAPARSGPGPRRARGLRDHRPDDPDDGVHPGRRRGPRRAVRRADGLRLPLAREQAGERPLRDRRRRAEVRPDARWTSWAGRPDPERPSGTAQLHCLGRSLFPGAREWKPPVDGNSN